MNKKIYYQFFFFPLLLMVLLSVLFTVYRVSGYTKNILLTESLIDEMILNTAVAVVFYISISALIFYFLASKIKGIIKINEVNIDTLNNKIDEQVQELKSKDILLMQKSKNEALGKMISIITHQWRQPLNAINSITANMYKDTKLDELNQDKVVSCINEIEDMTDFMSQTISDFSDFYTPESNKHYFNVKSSIEETFNIVFPKYCKKDKPEINIESSEDIELLGLKSNFQQVFLTLINNSVENFEIKKIENPKINIQLFKEDYLIKIVFSDNGNGIDKNIIDKVFDPHVTTKSDNPQRGLGLSIAQEVLKTSFDGTIDVENSEDNVIFTIMVKNARQ